MHPTLWVFDEDRPSHRFELLLVLQPRSGPVRAAGELRGAPRDMLSVEHSWQHTFEDIVGSLLGEGLVIEELREYPKITWQHMPFMVQDADGYWVLPPDMPQIPLLFSLTARKPA